jgi:hypothetical protein
MAELKSLLQGNKILYKEKNFSAEIFRSAMVKDGA